jgi:hypothetical protein
VLVVQWLLVLLGSVPGDLSILVCVAAVHDSFFMVGMVVWRFFMGCWLLLMLEGC